MIRKLASFGVLGLALVACGQTLDAPQAVDQDLESMRQGANLKTLQPGKFQFVHQELKVNVVMIGYKRNGPRGVDESALRQGLPKTYKGINRIPSFYNQEFNGTSFSYDYKVKFADRSFEDSFFKYLSSIAVEKPLTLFQQQYNCQNNELNDAGECVNPASNIGKVIEKNHWIDAPKVEKWLSYNADRIGVNTKEYTVFLINWFDRPDFKFHVYTKTDEPDPDTGYNFGEVRSSRKMVAWGGTTPDDKQSGLGKLSRLWFLDLSAGPEFFTSMYDVSNADVDGDEITDYRMPPIWDYNTGKATYRPFNDLSNDLGKIVRNVAVNLLFTASPIYRAGLTQPVLPDTVKLVNNIYQGLPGTDGKALVKNQLLLEQLRKLQPLTEIKLETREQPYTAEAKAAYECLATNTGCGDVPSFAALFVYNLFNLDNLISFDQKVYELPMASYVVPDNVPAPFLGLADDDYRTGTQSFVYGIVTPELNQFYGLTTTLIHEVGHHVAMSHPHDGYDSEAGIEYGTTGDYTYSWFGDQSNSIMSYIDLNWDFSQFDRDNMNRYLVTTYINQSNAILAEIAKSPKAGLTRGALQAADRLAGDSIDAYRRMDYLRANVTAKVAYKTVLETAQRIGVELKPFRWYDFYRSGSVARTASVAKTTPTRPNPEFLEEPARLKKRRAPSALINGTNRSK